MTFPNNSLKIPVIQKSVLVFEESFIRIRKDQLQVETSPSYSYYSLLTHSFAVSVLATTVEGFLILTQEYRHPTAQVILGCPSGYIDPGENPLQAAERELKEETGYHAESFEILGSAFPFSGFSGQKTIFVKASGAICSAPPELEPSEIIQARLFKLDALLEIIAKGTELDGNLSSALFFYCLNNHFYQN